MKIKLPEYPNKRIIYSALGVIGGTPWHNFPVLFDTTNHFSFSCPECSKLVDIVGIDVTNYNGYPEVYFTLHCSRCNVMGTRKIWVGDVK